MLIQVKVKPRARESSLVQAADGTWLAKLRAPPVRVEVAEARRGPMAAMNRA